MNSQQDLHFYLTLNHGQHITKFQAIQEQSRIQSQIMLYPRQDNIFVQIYLKKASLTSQIQSTLINHKVNQIFTTIQIQGCKQWKGLLQINNSRILQIPQFECSKDITECSICNQYFENSLRQIEIQCRLCVYKNTQKGIRPNGQCQQLPIGQMYNAWGQIVGCDSSKCKCDLTGQKCIECLNPSEFIYQDFQTCDPICIQERWEQGRFCQKCNPNGQFQSSQGGFCEECTNQFLNCNQCTQQQCKKCQQGFGFDFLSSTCIKCSDGFIIISDFCIKQPLGCKKITESSLDLKNKTIICDECLETDMMKQKDGSCTKCPVNTYIDQINNLCKKCSLRNCKICPQDQCTVCNDEYDLIDGQCQIKLSNCNKYSEQRNYIDQNVCKQCPIENYYINNCTNFDQICAMCLPCQLENKTQYLNEMNKCQNCQYTCKTCESVSMCLECVQPGVQAINGICRCNDISMCLMCDVQGCFKCPQGSQFVREKNSCVQSEFKCDIGFLEKINKSGGVKCYCQSLNCKYCDFQNGNKCEVCNEQYELKDGICIQCPQGYLYDKIQQKCVCPFVKNCSWCSKNNNLKCDQCLNEYELTDEGIYFTICDKCYPSYLFNSQSKQCECQIKNCSLCTQNSNLNLCIQCEAGFTWDSFKNKCTACNIQDNCKSCSIGYKIQNQKCVCDTENGFYLIDNNCFQCHKSCKTCYGDQNNQCMSCFEDYFLQNASCETVFMTYESDLFNSNNIQLVQESIQKTSQILEPSTVILSSLQNVGSNSSFGILLIGLTNQKLAYLILVKTNIPKQVYLALKALSGQLPQQQLKIFNVFKNWLDEELSFYEDNKYKDLELSYHIIHNCGQLVFGGLVVGINQQIKEFFHFVEVEELVPLYCGYYFTFNFTSQTIIVIGHILMTISSLLTELVYLLQQPCK
ncbi:hypothetical protein ABPG73_008875 [Tetrahymena malaccensis]